MLVDTVPASRSCKVVRGTVKVLVTLRRLRAGSDCSIRIASCIRSSGPIVGAL
jgi:hypothetical protein